jgi:outer membrane protein
MKQIKTLLIAAILILGANQTISAQAKTAHVDVNDVMAKMPAMLDAQKQLEKLSTTYDADYKKMVEEYQGKLKKYEAEAATVTAVSYTHLRAHETG